MNILNLHRTGFCGLVILASLLVVSQAPAQFFPGGGGGFGGQRRGHTSSSRTYNANSTVGDAVISIDPETRNLIVIADDETAAYIQQVIANLDAPKPEVLIKVLPFPEGILIRCPPKQGLRGVKCKDSPGLGVRVFQTPEERFDPRAFKGKGQGVLETRKI